jgi:hypothetical protein
VNRYAQDDRISITHHPSNVRFGSKGDISVVLTYVRFSSESGHQLSALGRSVKSHKQTHAVQQIIGGLG